ncbi:MAG: HAD family hydrolase [Anaerolineae bacterium]|nr:HAD family hydrolase [Anaerolineae bacterium]
MRPAIFLDRDGVIIENRADYVRSWADVAIYPQALAALARLKAARWPVIIVTNQSMVGRGLVSLADAEAINQRLVTTIASNGGQIDRVYMCPHAPDAACGCRKPQPGLLLQAAEELALDVKGSILVGDALTDIEAAQAAGVGRAALVLTGRGAVQARLPEATALGPPLLFDTLYAAVDAFLASTPLP